MQNFSTENKNKKYVNLNELGILLSGSMVKNEADFEKKMNKTGLLNMAWFIPVGQITSFKMNEKSGRIIVRYLDEKGKEKNEKIAFDNESDGKATADFMKKHFAFTEGFVEQENKLMTLLPNVFWILFFVLIAWVLYISAIEYQETGAVDLAENSRRKGAAMLLTSLAKILGPTGSILVGIAGVGFFAVKAFLRFQKPAKEIHFQKESSYSTVQ